MASKTKQVTVQLTAREARSLEWLLGARYGKRYKLPSMIRLAAMEMAKAQADKLLKEIAAQTCEHDWSGTVVERGGDDGETCCRCGAIRWHRTGRIVPPYSDGGPDG